jgi:hypothetical protein
VSVSAIRDTLSRERRPIMELQGWPAAVRDRLWER